MVNADQIRSLINQPEGPKLEFKREVNLDDKYVSADFLYHVLSLTNSLGNTTAYIVIGIDDKSREIIGLENSKGIKDETLQNLVREYCSPPIQFRYEVVEINNLNVGVVSIPPSNLKPHYFVKEIRGAFEDKKQWSKPKNRIFTRSGSTTVEATPEEINLMHREAENIKAQIIALDNMQGMEKEEEVNLQDKSTIPITFSPPPRSRGFIGREEELQRLNKELLKTPVVLIEGLPGIGKTSLAAQYIRHNEELKNHPVFWLECQENTNVDNLLGAFSDYGRQNLDMALVNLINEDRPFNDRIHKLIELLDTRSALLILDGFERTDKASMQLFTQEVLEHSDQFRIIICTRERPKNFMNILTDIGEVRLSGLAEGDAVELIRDKIILDDEELLRQVAIKTEGHPLAIRLFIPLVRDYGISPLALLQDSPEFGKSLEEHWLSEIFSRLSDKEREILENFSVFLEPISKEGIQSVVQNQEISNHLQNLQDKFLLTSQKNGFSTHALIREFCFKQLTNKGQLLATADRAADFYLRDYQITDFVKDMSPEEAAAKLRAHHYRLLGGQFFSAAQIVHNIESTLMRWGQASQLFVLIDQTLETVDESLLEQAQKTEWNRIVRWLNYYKGRILFTRGQLDNSLQIFEKLMSTRDRELLAECTQMLANIYLEQNRPLEVIQLFEENIKIFKHREKKLERVFDKVARAYIQVGDLEKAINIYNMLLNWQQADNDQMGGASTLRQLAIVHQSKNDLVNALSLATLSELLAKQTGDKYIYAGSALTLGEIYYSQHNKRLAIEWFENTLKCYIELDNIPGTRQVGNKLLRLYMDHSDADRRDEISKMLDSLAPSDDNK